MTQKQAKYIINENPQVPIFHLLPKLHKPSFPPTLRPIVSVIIIIMVDSLLQPLIRNTLGHLKDSKHVLSVVDTLKWQEGYVWITADVTSLYTVIPHDLANVTLERLLGTYSNYSQELQAFLLLAVQHLQKHNFLMFDRCFYLQVMGALMGAKFSPLLAYFYMSWWESLFIFCLEKPFSDYIVWYGRYIDDLLIIWRSGVAAVPDLS